MFHIALFEPEIAGNTGSIARTSLATGCSLHLIRPFGFRLTDDALKRSAMDYWQDVDLHVHTSFQAFAEAFTQQFETGRVFSLTTKASKNHCELELQKDDVFLFGPESRGLPKAIRDKTVGLRIPMTKKARSLNLAVSAAVLMYEAWRQLEFENA